MRRGCDVELFCLRISTWLNVACLFLNGVVGVRNDSTALVFDAIYCAVSAMTYFLLTIYSKKIDSPADTKFQYGYAKLEPVIIVIQALGIIFSCLFALLMALRDIFHHHLVKSYFEITLLQSFLAIICFIISLMCYYYARKYNNQIILVQAMTWFLDCIQSVLMTLAFFIGIMVEGTKYAWISPYIDPIALCFFVVTVIRSPLILLHSNFMQLLDVSPEEDTADKIENIIYAITKKNMPHLEIERILQRKAGGKIFISVQCNSGCSVSIKEMAKLKKMIDKNLKNESFHVDLQIAV